MTREITITAPKIDIIRIRIEGTAPYVQHKFSQKARREMLEAQMMEGNKAAKAKKIKEPRNPEQEYNDAMHLTSDGKRGIPAPAFRSAMISACRLVGFTMTHAKLSIFVEPDDFDVDDGTPLVYIEGEPELHEAAVRLASGVSSISIRPMWRTWRACVTIAYDTDQFTREDVINLMLRAGIQVGIGEGRPDSKKSHGMGWGTFRIVEA